MSSDMKLRSKLLRGFLLAVASVTVIAAVVIFNRPASPPKIQGVFLPEARPIEPFTLIDHYDRAFTRENLKGDWHLVSYGFSACPDICPTTLSQINRMLEGIEEGQYAQLRVLFYSVDHKRDTPSQMANYVPYFNSSFIGLTHLDNPKNPHLPFEKSLGITAKLTPRPSESDYPNPNDYDVSHGVTLFLVNPEGELQAIFKPNINSMGFAEFDPVRLRNDYLAIRKYLG